MKLLLLKLYLLLFVVFNVATGSENIFDFFLDDDDDDNEAVVGNSTENRLEIGEYRIRRAAIPEYPDYWSDNDRQMGRQTATSRARKCGISYVGRDPSMAPQRHGRRKRQAAGTLTDSGDAGTEEEQGRIVGGVETQPHEYPWQVSVRYMMGHICGGSLVANRFVITAAHCFTNFLPIDPSSWKILLGKHLSQFGEEGEVIADVADIIIHENYGRHATSKHDSDIAIVELVMPIPFSQIVSPICIPGRAARLFPGTECWVVGWGETYKSSGLTTVLRKALVPVIDTNMCRKFSTKLSRSVTDNMLCAGYAGGGVDSCQGDSGGPLMCEVNGRWVLSGVVSWGIGCAEKNSPGIYTNTKKFVPWLMNHMKRKLRAIGFVDAFNYNNNNPQIAHHHHHHHHNAAFVI